MFNSIIGGFKVITNASSGFGKIKESLEVFKKEMVDIDGHDWDKIIEANQSKTDYDQVAFSTMVQLINMFPDSFTELTSVNANEVSSLAHNLDSDCIPKINSEKTYQLGLAIQRLSNVINESSVKAVLEGLVQIGKLNEKNMYRRINILNKRLDNFAQIKRACHIFDDYSDSKLLTIINNANSELDLYNLEKEISHLNNIISKGKNTFESNVISNSTISCESILELINHYAFQLKKIENLLESCKQAFQDKREYFEKDNESHQEKQEGILRSKLAREIQLTRLSEAVRLTFFQMTQANENLSRAKSSNMGAFVDTPNLPTLLNHSEQSLHEKKRNYELKLNEACYFFESLLPVLNTMGSEPIEIDIEIQERLLEFLTFDIHEDIPSDNWKSLMGVVQEVLQTGRNYQDSNWYSNIIDTFIGFAFNSEYEDDITDAQFLKDIIEDKLYIFQIQRGIEQPFRETIYLKENEFLSLDILDQAILYIQEQPKREMIQKAEMEVLMSMMEHLLSKQSYDLFNLECHIAEIEDIENKSRSLQSKLAGNSSESMDVQISYLVEIINGYGLYHQDGTPDEPSIDSLSILVDQQTCELKDLLQKMQTFLSSDNNSSILKTYQDCIEHYRKDINTLDEEKTTRVKQSKQLIQNEKEALVNELSLMNTLKIMVARLETSGLTGIHLTDAKQKLSKQLSIFSSKYSHIHRNDENHIFSSEAEDILVSVKQLQTRVNAVKEPILNIIGKSIFPPKQHSDYEILYSKYFGNPDNNQQGLFYNYLDKRAEKYAFKDMLSNIAAVFLGCFGYKTDQAQRQEYIDELKKDVKQFVTNPGDAIIKEALQTKIIYARDHFKPRCKPGESDYKDSLDAHIKMFVQDFRTISHDKRQTKENIAVGI